MSCYGSYLAAEAARMQDEHQAVERRVDAEFSAICASRDALDAIVATVLEGDESADIAAAIVRWYACSNADKVADAAARKAITDAIATAVDKAIHERVDAILRDEGVIL